MVKTEHCVTVTLIWHHKEMCEFEKKRVSTEMRSWLSDKLSTLLLATTWV